MRGTPLEKKTLKKLYDDEQKSAAEIAPLLRCSINKVHYWLARRGIKARARSDASYIKHNPNGDPFHFRKPKTVSDHFLLGLGLGLYWGEGTKRNKTSARLGNTDPALIRAYLRFLQRMYAVDHRRIRFGLQIFSDMNPEEALHFWVRSVGFPRSHFGKVIVTPARGVGTYREKTKHGVLTVYVSSTKLRKHILEQIEKL